MVRLKAQVKEEGLAGTEDGTGLASRRSTRIAKNREIELSVVWLKDQDGILQPYACVDKPSGDVDQEDHVEAIHESLEAQEKTGGWWMYDFQPPGDDQPTPKKHRSERPKSEKGEKGGKRDKENKGDQDGARDAAADAPGPSGDVDAVILVKAEAGSGTTAKPKSAQRPGGTAAPRKPPTPAPASSTPGPTAAGAAAGSNSKAPSSQPGAVQQPKAGAMPAASQPSPLQLAVPPYMNVNMLFGGAKLGAPSPLPQQQQQFAAQQAAPLPPQQHQLQQLPPRNQQPAVSAAAPVAAPAAAPPAPSPAAASAAPAASATAASAPGAAAPVGLPLVLLANQGHPRPHGLPSKCCSNCGVTATSAWRRTKDTRQLVCNSCGDYYRRNGRHRRITGGPVRLAGQEGFLEDPRPPAYATAIAAQQAVASASSADGAQIAPFGEFNPPPRAPPKPLPEDGIKRCFNCGSDKTPTWRRDAEGSLLCNACGLYYRSMGRHRPVALVSRLGGTPVRVGGGSSSGGSGDGTSRSSGSGGIKRMAEGSPDADPGKRLATGLVLGPDGSIAINMGAGVPPAPLGAHQLSLLQHQLALQQQMAMQAAMQQHQAAASMQQQQEQQGQQGMEQDALSPVEPVPGMYMAGAFVDAAAQQQPQQEQQQ